MTLGSTWKFTISSYPMRIWQPGAELCPNPSDYQGGWRGNNDDVRGFRVLIAEWQPIASRLPRQGLVQGWFTFLSFALTLLNPLEDPADSLSIICCHGSFLASLSTRRLWRPLIMHEDAKATVISMFDTRHAHRLDYLIRTVIMDRAFRSRVISWSSLTMPHCTLPQTHIIASEVSVWTHHHLLDDLPRPIPVFCDTLHLCPYHPAIRITTPSLIFPAELPRKKYGWRTRNL